MRTYVSSIAACSLAAAFAACGDGSLSISDALHDSASRSCKKAFACMSTYPTTTGTTFVAAYGATEAECVSSGSGLVTLGAQQVQASVDAGRIVYNSSDAQTCIDSIGARTCGQWWGTESYAPLPACLTAFTGTVADGGACTLDDDCASTGSQCNTSKVCAPA
jgi:hypothetical protein